MKTNQEAITAITQVLHHYFKGIYEGDTILLGSTFHPGILLFGDIKGQPYAKTLDQYLGGVQSRKSPKDSGQPFTSDIISIDAVNSIAIAKVRVQMYDFNYYEFLSFHQVNGKWLIVNKMITHVDE
ncbi:putative lumazine-binding-domain-containing protein [Russula earlei]|uniref:Lumazine-binding-domain-containing protein n=1 Tax=Russula earlei TaxID=71964 RepID=A0ACC0TY72_9AGAM|nr:putative lumazine-binding-domain-containing protein [Russula earlei]